MFTTEFTEIAETIEIEKNKETILAVGGWLEIGL
jgi:hypothetical protein